jgi:hypothetical protein
MSGCNCDDGFVLEMLGVEHFKLLLSVGRNVPERIVVLCKA